MTASRCLAFALGLALATPVAAYAYEAPTVHHHSRHRVLEHRPATTAPTPLPEARLWRPSYTSSHRQLELEGLTRNPDDCVKYGCLGNN